MRGSQGQHHVTVPWGGCLVKGEEPHFEQREWRLTDYFILLRIREEANTFHSSESCPGDPGDAQGTAVPNLPGPPFEWRVTSLAEVSAQPSWARGPGTSLPKGGLNSVEFNWYTGSEAALGRPMCGEMRNGTAWVAATRCSED